jgi:hypothetical protein
MLEPVALQDLKQNFRGELLTAIDAEYDGARRVWNGMIDRRPALIARCVSAADVIQCVNFARARNLSVSVRGGAHNIAGNTLPAPRYCLARIATVRVPNQGSIECSCPVSPCDLEPESDARRPPVRSVDHCRCVDPLRDTRTRLLCGRQRVARGWPVALASGRRSHLWRQGVRTWRFEGLRS